MQCDTALQKAIFRFYQRYLARLLTNQGPCGITQIRPNKLHTIVHKSYTMQHWRRKRSTDSPHSSAKCIQQVKRNSFLSLFWPTPQQKENFFSLVSTNKQIRKAHLNTNQTAQTRLQEVITNKRSSNLEYDYDV